MTAKEKELSARLDAVEDALLRVLEKVKGFFPGIAAEFKPFADQVRARRAQRGRT